MGRFSEAIGPLQSVALIRVTTSEAERWKNGAADTAATLENKLIETTHRHFVMGYFLDGKQHDYCLRTSRLSPICVD